MSKNSNSEWYRESFSDDYLWLYSHRSVDAAASEVASAIKHLPFESNQRLLDLACGAGRHMIAFSDFGASVTGVDLSQVLLSEAKNRLQESNVRASLVRADMRNLPFRNFFDGVTMWFTSFGYFRTIREDLQVLKSISSVLRTGGWWWIDIPNPSHLAAKLIPYSERTVQSPYGTAFVIERRKISKGSVVKTIEVEDPEGKRTYVERVRLYPPEHFGSLIRRAGLTSLGILGDYDGSPFTPDVPRQIWYGLKTL